MNALSMINTPCARLMILRMPQTIEKPRATRTYTPPIRTPLTICCGQYDGCRRKSIVVPHPPAPSPSLAGLWSVRRSCGDGEGEFSCGDWCCDTGTAVYVRHPSPSQPLTLAIQSVRAME